MKSRNWVKLFLTTLLVGAISTSIVGFALKWSEYKPLFLNVDVIEILSILLWLIGVGFIFSIISQMGFFAYLTVHRFGLGIFRKLWNPVQLVIIAFVFFDLIYFRYQAFAADRGDSLISYITIALVIFIYCIVIALIKTKMTNKHAFVPALFFMYVISIIEWFPALRVNEASWLYLMIIPLLICNAYQLLILPKIANEKS
ncbi:KinB-signaling pathway activation protein [Litchfieldia salsa]|uniref:KinB signaling pathway activation protein n=1 Tax=Litchfieldia salsa TaxID=930152 RepID=A0A1H0WTU8_9BACI|nr:KinB-signaling pathway activation protein [Litchfieldia salsa]SDP94194.1 KinB signaling pathway activation protein [Litchfieldia salsa]